MNPGSTLRRIATGMLSGPLGVKSFERELAAAGGLAFRVDLGVRAISTEEIVGSVGRHEVRRRDFLARDAAGGQRYRSVATAMARDVALPVIEVYELRVSRAGPAGAEVHGEYYVVDGHHRVAAAKQLGRAFLDAHVILYRAAREIAD